MLPLVGAVCKKFHNEKVMNVKSERIRFMHDVSLRLANRVQLTNDGHHPYFDAVDNAFQLNVDFAQLVKI